MCITLQIPSRDFCEQHKLLLRFRQSFWGPLKFIYSENGTKFCKMFALLLTGTTKDKSKVKISQNFEAFSEYMNFICYFYLLGALKMQWDVGRGWTTAPIASLSGPRDAHMLWSIGWKSLKQKPFFLEGRSISSQVDKIIVPIQWLLC